MRGWHKGLMLPKGTYMALMLGWSQKGPEMDLGVGLRGGGEGSATVGAKGGCRLTAKGVLWCGR